MIEVGRTALSVEIMTKASTPCSPASSPEPARREDVVLDRLARVRLHHRHVLVGGRVEHDLRAGSSPRICASAARRRRRRRAARPNVVELSERVRRSSCSISKSANSARSTSRIRAGRKRATCRASSDPMEPPAPVTMTVFPSRNPPTTLLVELHRLAARRDPRSARRGSASPAPSPGAPRRGPG